MRLTIRKTLKRSWLAALAVVGVGSTALAGPIEVTNADFEAPDLSEGATWSNDLTDAWTNPNDAGGSFIERIGGFAAKNAQHVGTQNGAFIFQNTGVAAEPNTTYTLIVGVGNRNASFSPEGATAILGLTVLDGDATLAEADATAQVAADEVLTATAVIVPSPTVESSFEDRTLTFTTGAEVPPGGITIFLGDDATDGRSHFDNVRLYSQPAGTNIGPESEFQTAALALNAITVDGNLSEWNATPIVNPRNRVGGDGTGELVPFEPFGGGTWDGPEDHSNTTYFTYDADNIYVGIVVTDDYHENAANSAWNGDAVQLHVANGARDTNVALYNYFLGGVDGALADAAAVQDEKAAGEGGTSVAIVREGTTTTYEICIPKAAAGLEELAPGVQLGLGMTINDGDEAEPGQKGWGGIGTHAIVYNGKTPSETALVTLGAPYDQVWTVGLPGDAWPADLGTGGGPETVFVQEAGVNELPGDPASPVENQQSDDDYYFAGVYDTVLDGGAYTPVGTVAENEIGAERAFAGDDNSLRYHFNFPANFGPATPLAVVWDANNLHQGDTPDPRYGVEVYVNGVLVGAETLIQPGNLGLINKTPQFTLADVNGMVGEGFDNYVELRGVNYSADGGGNWMGVDHVSLAAASTGGGGDGLNIAFVSFHDTDGPSAAAAAADPPLTEASDKGYTDLLTANGHTVTRVLTAPDRTDADFLNGFDLVIISRAVSSGHYSSGANAEFWNTQVTAPVMNLGGYTFRSSRLNWTDGTAMVDTDGPVSLSVAVAEHPIFAGVDTSGPYANFIEGERGVSFNMDNVVGGNVLATAADTPTAGGAAIFEFAAGAEVNNGNVLAGPRLAFLTGSRELGRTSETSAFYDLTDSGEAMFLNAVNYMGAGGGFEFPAPNAVITWSDVNPDTTADDLIGGSSVTFTPMTIEGNGNAEGAFFTGDGGDSGNAELNAVYNSHSWNAAGFSIVLDGLEAGTEYHIQLLGAGDTRGCCNTRTQTADDLNGNVSGEFLRGNSSVTGTFTATGPTQEIAIAGETDPGLSGYILADGAGVVSAVNIARPADGEAITVTAGPTIIDSYAGSFDFDDGTTDLGDGSTISSNNDAAPASVQGGALRLTTAENGGGGAAFVFPGGFDGSEGWTMTFDLVVEHTGGNTPADGLSINYGAIPGPDNYGNPAEEGYRHNDGEDPVPHISYQVDTWLWDSLDQDSGVEIMVNGRGERDDPPGAGAYLRATGDDANFKPNERVETQVTLTWGPENGASFVTNNLRTNANFINIPTPDFNPDASYGFSILARTGGHNETVEIDNIDLQKGWTNLGRAPTIDPSLLKLRYEFEEGEGAVVANSAGQTFPTPAYFNNFEDGGAEGAPGSSTPTAGLNFPDDNSGCIETGLNVESLIGDNGYTMVAWMKPSNVSGQKVLFGQTSQGIHNGIRNDSFLHNAHWGNDHNAATTVVADEWMHAAWVYDREAGTSQIYLNGVLDRDGAQADPNVLAADIIIGNRDGCGGGDGFVGDVDDIAIWDEPFSADQIAQLAGGISPAPAGGEVLADSIADWAGTDEQGVNGWTYGYRPLEFDGPADYDQADFVAFDTANGWAFNAELNKWDWADGNVPWTEIGEEAVHPNTTDDILQHAVRRWTSDFEGDVLITYHGREVNLGGGGVTVGVHVNGTLLDQASIAGGDDVGVTNTVAATLAVGDVVDLFLSPTDADGTEADGSDGSAFSMVIESVGSGAPDGLITTTDGNVWRVGNQSDNDTLSAGGPGYMYFNDSNGADATFIDTGMTPADLGIQDAPYTMMARVRQEGPAAGDGMIFGQATGEVLHNGSRDSVLYMGHWGADHGGGSVAFDQWRHITFVYDGADQIIYVDGTEVTRSTSGDKAGLGTGNKSKDNILIGLTRPDQDRDFIGCLDDVRIYCGQLTADQIRAIACESPRADCDGDGIWDSVELAVFGTLDRDGTGDFDGDRLNDATEFALGTAMDNRDTDGDNLWDSAEVWGFRSDPLGGDSDGDGVSDDAEVAAGTDPTTDDTDRDGITDGDELANGPTTTTFDFSTDPGLELLNFSDGATPPEVRAEGGNPGGYLSLTDAENGARATIIFPDTTGGQNIAGFRFGVDARIGGGTPRPADGLSVSLVRGDDPVLADPIGSTFAGTTDLGGTEESLPEEGTRTGVSVGFDAWESGGDDIVGFSVRVDGVLVDQIAAGTLNGELDDPTSLQTGPRLGDDPAANLPALGWARFEINLAPDGLLDVSWKGSKLVEGVQTNWTPSPGQLVFAARTGGANQAHHFDNLSLVTIPEGSADPLVFNEGAVAAGLKVHYEFDDFDAAPAPEATSFIAADADAAGPAGLKGQYWSLPPKAMLTNNYPLHRAGDGPEGEDISNSGFADGLFAANPVPSGTFVATDLNYTGDDLTPIVDWLGADGASYEGDTSETAILGDGLFRMTGYLWVPEAGEQTISTNSDDGSVIYINNQVVVQHDNGHGQNGDDPLPPNQLATVNFEEAGYYPVDIRYFNGDWTNDAGDHGGANLATTGLDPANLVQSVAGAGGNVVTNLGHGPDGTLVGSTLIEAAQTVLGEPTETYTEVVANDAIPTLNGRFDGADLLDATFQIIVDPDAKTEGGPELLFESGGGTIGTSMVYEAPSTIVMRSVGLGGNAVVTASAPLSQADLDAGELELIFTHDSNSDGPETIAIWVNRSHRASASLEKSNDWSGGNGASFGGGTTSLAAGGGNTNLPGGSVDFASGTLVSGAFYRDTLFTSGILSLNGDGSVYVDTNLTGPETGASGDNYTMFATVTPADLNGDNMVFGQASGNVLHNGFRDAGVHQGHWGNDQNVGTVAVGQSYDLAWRYTAGRQSIYMNGELLGSAAPRGPLAELGNVLIGATRLDQDRSFNGDIDSVRIYCRSLSHEAIRDIQGGSRPVAERLLVHYEFEQGISLTVENTGNAGVPDGALNSLDVISAYGSGSPSIGGPGHMNFDSTNGADATFIDTGLTPASAGIELQPYTMTAWVRQTATGDGDNADAMVFGQVGGEVLHNGARGTQPYLGHWGDDVGGGSINLDQWTHYAWTFDGNNAAGEIAVYQNGVKIASDTKNGLSKSPDNILVGTTRLDQNRDFIGQLDDVRIYQGVLTTNEIVNVAGLVDSDGDGLMDSFERAFFGNLAMGAAGDIDMDGISNIDEQRLGLDPTVNDARFADADGDGWSLGDETEYESNPNNPNSVPTPFVGGGQWEVRTIQAAAAFTGLEAAIALINGEAEASSDDTTFHDFINFGTGAQGIIDGDEPFPAGAADNFVTHAKATIEVTETTEYIFSYSTDDGMRITVNGDVIGEVNAGRGAPGNVIPYAVTLVKGRHEVELIQYEQTGGDAAEFAGTFASENSLNGLGGSTVFLVPAAGEEAPGGGSPLADGLIGYWPFDGDFEDKAGDSHGTEVGDAPIEFAEGVFGQGIDLNGSQHVTTPVENEAMFDFEDGNFSVSAWFRVDNFDKGWQALVTKGEGSNWRIHRRAETDHLGPVAGPTADNPNGGADMVDGPDVNDGEIHHVIITNGPEGSNYYLDGILAGEAPAGGTQGNEWPMMIGENADQGGLGRQWEGLIDEVAVWNRQLSADEVGLLANGPSIGEQIAASATDIVVYEQDFNGFDDGATDLGDGTVFAGTAVIDGGQLRLTEDGVAGGGASFSIPALPNTSKGWTATFDLTIFDSEGANNPADGVSLNYGNAALGEIGSAEEGMAGAGSVTENLSFEIDTWQNFDAEQGVNIAEKVGGVDTNLAFTNGPILNDGSTVGGPVTIIYDPENGASFFTEGLETNAIFDGVETSFVGDDAYTFIFSARVGGANESLWIDNLVITTPAEPGGGVAGLLGYWPSEYVSTADNHLDLGTIPAQDLDSQFSWSFWSNSGEGNGPNNTIFGNRYMADGADFDPREFIKFTPTQFEWHFNGGGENVGNDDTVIPVGEWVHNLVVKDGANITYYRNGAEVASGVVTGTPVNPQPLFLGGVPNADGNTAEGYIGSLKEVATFDRALSAADVTDVYNRGANGQSLSGDPRSGAVAKSSGPLSAPTLVDFGAIEGDASYEFAFNAVKEGASTALAGNTAWALKLDQWNETGFMGTTEFGVADNTSDVPAVFGADTHVVFVSDTAAGETRIYVNGALGGTLGGNPALSGMVTVMGATRDAGPIDVFGAGSVMHGWATYNSALSDAEVAALAGAPFGGGGPSGPMPIAHWPLDEIVDGMSPDVVGDRHLTANNLTADDVVEGADGMAVAFDAARETLLHYTAADGEATATSNPAYTVSMWVKVKGTGQNDLRVFSEASTTSGTPLFNLGTANNGADDSLDLYMRTQDNGNPYNHPHTTGMPFDDTWHHIAFTEDNGQIAVYIDGVLDDIDTAAELPDFGGGINTTSIGGILRANPSHWVTGVIDDVKIFDVALTAEEVAAEAGVAGQASSVKQLVDTDRDGTADVLERLAGTDVNDPSDYFHISSIAPADEGLMISFDGVEGHAYEIEFSEDLSKGSWQVVGSEKADVTAPVEFMHADKPAGKGFYRARLVQD